MTIGFVNSLHALAIYIVLYLMDASTLSLGAFVSQSATYICDRICKKGPLRGNENTLVRDKIRAKLLHIYVTEFAKRDHIGAMKTYWYEKIHAKPPFHAITDYCIVGT